jgi:hypothetical protein
MDKVPFTFVVGMFLKHALVEIPIFTTSVYD